PFQRADRHIVCLGEVSAEALPSLYAGAAALVHPALREGFGLPMLEAMAAGCPVVACRDAIPKVLRPAARSFAPSDVAGLRVEVEALLADEGQRTALVNEGRTLAASLTWDRCAEATAGVYRDVLEEVPR
ncbi:MAG: glycosyltransferase, partial [Candidatus Eremiobacteraeota bacterium]|nr:glycosyltransferase [Candidatus Eremiobacteraeota bacterium]